MTSCADLSVNCFFLFLRQTKLQFADCHVQIILGATRQSNPFAASVCDRLYGLCQEGELDRTTTERVSGSFVEISGAMAISPVAIIENACAKAEEEAFERKEYVCLSADAVAIGEGVERGS